MSDVKDNAPVENAGAALPMEPYPLTNLATNGEVTVISPKNDFEDLAGQGLENVTARDLLIPRITILQALSPQVSKNKPEYIKGCEVGDFCDVSLAQILPKPLVVIPVYFAKQWLEWFPRGTNKGLANIHLTDEIVAQTKEDENRRKFLPNGNLIVETAQIFVLNLSCDMRRNFIPFSSTQWKKARGWLNLATTEKLARKDGTLFTPPLFYRSYQLTTVSESNNQGSWEGWKIERSVALPELQNYKWILDEAKTFRNELSSGNIRADIEAMKDEIETQTGQRPVDGYDRGEERI